MKLRDHLVRNDSNWHGGGHSIMLGKVGVMEEMEISIRLMNLVGNSTKEDVLSGQTANMSTDVHIPGVVNLATVS